MLTLVMSNARLSLEDGGISVSVESRWPCLGLAGPVDKGVFGPSMWSLMPVARD